MSVNLLSKLLSAAGFSGTELYTAITQDSAIIEAQLNSIEVGAGVAAWSGSGTYAAGAVVYSPINFRNYRNKTGAAGTDPSGDTVNWQPTADDVSSIWVEDIHQAASKATPVDADEIPLVDSAAAFALKKLTWANLKATLKTYFDGIYVALTGNQTIAGIKTFSSNIVTNGQVSFPATANPSADANTLDDYEEGTWTPNQGSGLTVTGAFTSSGTYTKIGRVVTIHGSVGGATNVSVSAGGQLCSNLPFAVSGVGMGSIMNAQTGASGGAMYCSTTSALSCVAIGPAINTLTFSCTYFA